MKARSYLWGEKLVPITDGYKGPIMGHVEGMYLKDGKVCLSISILEEYKIRDRNDQTIGYYPCVDAVPTADWYFGDTT